MVSVARQAQIRIPRGDSGGDPSLTGGVAAVPRITRQETL